MPTPNYVPTDWVDNTTPVNATNMDKIEAGIDVATDGVIALESAVTALDTRLDAEEAEPTIPPLVEDKWLTVDGGALVWADAPAGSGGGVDYKGAWAAPTPYIQGDVVLYNGVEYVAVNPSTGQTPPATQPVVGALPVIGMGTALPASPFDGQEFILVDSLTAPTFSWRLRYVAAKASNKWVFVGGSPICSEVLTSSPTTSTTYAVLASAGPSIVVPVVGDYDVEIGAFVFHTGGVDVDYMSFDVGATGAVDADALKHVAAGAGSAQVRSRRKALTAVTLTAKYRTQSGTGTFESRWMKLVPYAVGG